MTNPLFYFVQIVRSSAFVSQEWGALSSQLSAWSTKEYIEEKAKRGNWDAFERVLAKVPDVEPEERDRL